MLIAWRLFGRMNNVSDGLVTFGLEAKRLINDQTLIHENAKHNKYL